MTSMVVPSGLQEGAPSMKLPEVTWVKVAL